MFTIGEFSKITSLTVKTLRFYHEKGLLVPAAVDSATGYRSYDDRNVEQARVIVALRALEFPLETIAEILADCRAEEEMLPFLERQRSSLAERAGKLAGAMRQIDRLIQEQRQGREEQAMSTKSFAIEERELEPVLVAGVRMQGRYSDCGRGFAQLAKRLGRHIAGKPLCLYYDGEYREEDANFEPCFPVRRETSADGVVTHLLPKASCVSLIHRGPYSELGRSYAKVLKYAKERGYEVQLPNREVYLKGPGMIFRGNPQAYLTEIQLIVEPA
jgi:DNA-binding transcriptional MerR regulator/effector-binding domain-containing protein